MYHVIQQCARSLALVLFLGAGLAFTSTPAAGQVDVTPGLRVGVNAATAGGDAEELGAIFTGLAIDDNSPPGGTVSSRDGIMIGAFANVDFGAPVSVQPSVRWIQKGYSIEHGGNFFANAVTTEIKFSYIEVPVLARYDVPAKVGGFAPFLLAGPTIGFNLGAESEFGVEGDTFGLTETTQDLKDVGGNSAIGGTDFGLEFGAGASYSVRGLGTASADIRYGLGLSNVLKTDNFDQDFSLSNQVLSITLGFAL